MNLPTYRASPFVLAEFRTIDAASRLDRDGLRAGIQRVTGTATDRVAEWSDLAGTLLLKGSAEDPPFRASAVFVGAERWICLKESDAGDVAHVYIGLVPENGEPHSHIEVLRDARHVLPVLHRYARGWRGWRFWRFVSLTAELYLALESAEIRMKPRPTVWQAITGENVLKAAVALGPFAVAPLFGASNPAAATWFWHLAGLAGTLLVFGLLDWMVARRRTSWEIQGA